MRARCQWDKVVGFFHLFATFTFFMTLCRFDKSYKVLSLLLLNLILIHFITSWKQVLHQVWSNLRLESPIFRFIRLGIFFFIILWLFLIFIVRFTILGILILIIWLRCLFIHQLIFSQFFRIPLFPCFYVLIIPF